MNVWKQLNLKTTFISDFVESRHPLSLHLCVYSGAQKPTIAANDEKVNLCDVEEPHRKCEFESFFFSLCVGLRGILCKLLTIYRLPEKAYW